jgi:hypothetical protein
VDGVHVNEAELVVLGVTNCVNCDFEDDVVLEVVLCMLAVIDGEIECD